MEWEGEEEREGREERIGGGGKYDEGKGGERREVRRKG